MSTVDYCNSVLVRLPWSLVQQLQSVLNSAARLIFGLKRFDRITPALMDLHWLPYPQRITYKLCMIMFKCLRGSAPAYLADYCTSTSLVPGRSALRSAAHGDIVVPSHRTDWGLRSFAVAGPSSWNALPVDLRSSSFGLDTFAKHLKTHLFGLAYSRQSTHFWVCITFCRVRHGDSVTKPDYYYYYYPWAVYCDRPTQLYLKGRGKKNCGGTLSRGFGLRSFRPEITPEISAWGVFFGRRFTVKAHSTNTNTNTDTNTDLPIIKILRFVNFGRKLLRPKPLESVPVKVKVKVFLRIIFARKLGWCTRL